MRRSRVGMARRTVVLAVVVVLLGLAGVVAGIVVDRVRGPEWSAETGILIRLPTPEIVVLTGLSPTVGTEDLIDAAAVAKSQAVLTRAAATLKPVPVWSDLAEEVTVAPVGSSHLIKVTATAPDRDAAARTADAVATAYVQSTQERLRADMATLETVPRPPDPQRQGGSDVTADVRSRAVILGRAVTIAETFRTDQPVKLVPGVKTPAALGIVGLAAGALAAVVMTLLRPATAVSRHGAGAGRTDLQRTIAEAQRKTNGNGHHSAGLREDLHRAANGNGHRPVDTVRV